MAEQKWNPSQLLAIQTVGANLLVSAAAGSGKTSVLTERCIHLICDAKDRCSLEDLLVVTFTRAAAGEMKHRIEKRLLERIADHAGGGDHRHLHDQLRLLDRAEIGTLHGVCGRVVRRHFALLGIDPAFVTLDEHEAWLLKHETAERVIERALEADEDGAVQEFLDAHANSQESKLRALMLRVYDLSRSTVDPAGWSRQAVQRIEEAASAEHVRDSPLGRAYLQELVRHLDALLEDAAATRQAIAEVFPGYLDRMDGLIGFLEEYKALAIDGDYDGLRARVEEVVQSKEVAPRFSKLDDQQKRAKDIAKQWFDALRKQVDSDKSWIYAATRQTAAQWRQGAKQTLVPVTTLLRLVDDFAAAYRDAKLAARALDFSDLERLAFDVLRDPNSPIDAPAPSAAARQYQAQFRHVLVDEYQDINALQDAILRLLSHESSPDLPPNLFCVGDVKQSIYRFRLADPFRFIERSRRYAQSGKKGVNRLIPLSENFRSDPPVIKAVNAVFERLMTADWAEIEYDSDAALRPGHAPGHYQQLSPGEAAVELHLVSSSAGSENDHDSAGNGADSSEDDELDRTEREAAIIAQRIAGLVGGPDGFKYGDVAILLRAMAHKAQAFASMLRRFGVPVHTGASGGFFDAVEIRDMMSLLRVLDNPLQDIPLAALLRSPLCRMEQADDKLARIHLRYREDRRPFYRAVFDAAGDGATPTDLADDLRRITADIARWREDAASRPIAPVIWSILNETGYLAWCSALRDGRQRVANLLHLYDLARQFGTFQKQGLRRFLSFLRTLEEQSDLGQPNIVTDPGDVVRVMSVHRSKGLQFKVVIVPDLGKKMNQNDGHGSLLVDRDLGIAPQVVDLARRVRYSSLASIVASADIRRKLAAEELRVLYVAMTRAQRKLILLGTVRDAKKLGGWMKDWSGHKGPIPGHVLQRAQTMLDWIGPAYAASAVKEAPVIALFQHDDQAVKAAEEAAQKWIEGPTIARSVLDLRPLKPKPPAEQVTAQGGLLDAASWRHPLSAYSAVPAARAVTQLTKSGRRAAGGESPSDRGIVRFARPLRPPRFVRPGKKVTPAEIGQVTHRVLQSMRLTTPATAAAVNAEIKRLVDRKIIAADEAKTVDRDAIAWFLGTDLGRLLRDHPGRSFRELPIFVPVAAVVKPGEPALPPSDDPLDRTMLRGQIDALLRLPDGLVVLDYKTDQLTPETQPEREAFYRPQVREYCRAISRITGLPVVQAHLVFLTTRSCVAVDLSDPPTVP